MNISQMWVIYISYLDPMGKGRMNKTSSSSSSLYIWNQTPSCQVEIYLYIYLNIYISGNNRKLVPNIFGELEEGRIFTLAAPSLKKTKSLLFGGLELYVSAKQKSVLEVG